MTFLGFKKKIKRRWVKCLAFDCGHEWQAKVKRRTPLLCPLCGSLNVGLMDQEKGEVLPLAVLHVIGVEES